MRAQILAALLACVGCVGRESSAQRAAERRPAGWVAAYGGRLSVPAGFKVDEFAHVEGARAILVGPDGAVYVAREGAGTVVRLDDTNRDGAADRQTVVARGLEGPFGMAFHGGYFYIANSDGVVRMRVGAGGVPAGSPQRITHYRTGGHNTRTIVFGPDGAMYVSVGSSCNVCVERDSTRAAVMRYDADGRNGRVFARGLRNAVGLAVEPRTRQLWVTTHERDNLLPSHENLPPEEIDILRDGGDYGWPYCYSSGGRAVPNPEYRDAARCARTITAALEMQAHSGPMSLAFLDRATAFPEDWRGDALVAFHGSWNRDQPTGAKVVRIRVKDGRPVSYEDFVTGWQRPDGSRWGQPVGVAVAADGAVLISDDVGDTIYRVHR